MKFKSLFIVILILCIRCQQSQTISTIENAALTAHGGQRYKAVNKVSYEKKIWLLSQTGDTLSKKKEKHFVDFDGDQVGIKWYQDSIRWEATRIGDSVFLNKNGHLVRDSTVIAKTQRRLNGAQFVFWQPFKFINDGGEKAYLGERILFNGWKVEEIQVVYPNTNDRWSFFFDTESKKLKATGVFHNDRYSLITNDAQESETGLSLHQKRTSYFTDSLFIPFQKGTLYSYKINSINYW